MTGVRPLGDGPRVRVVSLAVLVLALTVASFLPFALPNGPSPSDRGRGLSAGTASFLRPEGPSDSGPATSIGTVPPVPDEVVAGAPADLAWQALDARGLRVSGFAVAGELVVTDSTNGSTVRSWANASVGGPLARAANGTFSVPSTAWSGGVLALSVSVTAAVPLTVRLFGPLLPAQPTPVALTVLPDLDHLVLSGPANSTAPAGWNDTFWIVRDRFGNPAPGALLRVAYSNGSSESTTFVPVTWTSERTTGAWVNFSVPATGSATLVVTDGAGTVLLGPIDLSGSAAPATTAASSLPPLAIAAVVLLAVGAVVGVVAVLAGGRTRPRAPARTEEEELERLAEGRATIVEVVRRKGPLALREIESAWEPPPAPPAVADWVASLVTDGTLTVVLGEDGAARYALVERPVGPPSVTLDPEALERGIARREAAVEREDEEDGPG